MIRAVIVDDDIKNRRILRKLVEEFCEQVLIVAEAANVKEAGEVIRETTPDLVFLDIELPYGNAFDLLQQFEPVQFEVIFITAFNEFALTAFRYNAIDYLLKPVNIEELKKAVEKASLRLQSASNTEAMQKLLSYIQLKQPTIPKIAISTMAGLEFVNTMDIVRLKSDSNYTHIYTIDGQHILSSKSIGDFEELLPGHLFVRIHNAHIINVQYIKNYSKGRGGYITLSDGTKIEVASRRKNDFLSRFE